MRASRALQRLTSILGWRSALLAAALAALLLGASARHAFQRTGAPTADAAAVAIAEAEGARQHWSARVTADPADFVAQERLAATLLRRFAQDGDPTYLLPALTAARAAVESARQPGSNAYVVLSAAQAGVHDFDGALDSARRAVELKPSSATAWIALSDAYAAQARHDEALEALRPALESRPGLTTYARAAALSLRAGDASAAHTAWELAFLDLEGQRSTDIAWALTLRAEFEGATGDADPHASLDAALRAFPGYHGARFERVHVAVDRGELESAQRQLERLIEELPTLDVARLLVWVTTARGDAEAHATAQAQLDVIERRYADAGVDITPPVVAIR